MPAASRPSRQTASSPPIARRTMLTIAVAACLGGLCAGYVHVTRPLLSPQEALVRGDAEDRADPADGPKDPLALKHLPDEPWAASAAWIVRNGQSVIYFNKVTPAGENNRRFEKNKALRLEPFAMIFPPRESRPDEEPLTVAGEAAILRFQGAIELPNPDPGRIVNVNIPKKVRLRGPDGLEIQGSNFTYNEEAGRLWSDDDVWFRQGRNHGRGHGMQLELFRVGSPDDFESVAVSGVKVFRLLRDVDMRLTLEEGGGPFAALDAEPPSASAPDGEAEPTRVRCAGAFTFDLDTNLARFNENVIATREVPDHEPDRLESETLEIQLAPGTPEARRAAAARRRKIKNGTLTEDDGFQGIDSDLQAETLVAHGGGRTATIHSPANEFVAEFDTLVHNATTGQTTLQRDGGRVVARQKTSTLESPRILLQPSEGDRPPSIVCKGQGKLHHRDEQGELALSAYWKDKLVRIPQDDGRDLIRLRGRAQVNQPREEFTLAAEEIDLSLRPAPETPEAVGSSDTAILDAGSAEPDTLTARQSVMLRSPELAADAATLNVDFVPAKAGELARRESRAALVPVGKQVRLASAGQTDDNPPPVSAAEPTESDNDDEESAETAKGRTDEASAPAVPLEMVAQVINVEMARQPAETADAGGEAADREARIRTVDTTGGVVVRQRREAGEEPLIIKGERLELTNRGENQELITIHGRYGLLEGGKKKRKPEPAQVHDGESDLWGMNINLDRAENTAWVDGEGVLILPADEANASIPLDPGAAAPKETDEAGAPSDAASSETDTETDAEDEKPPGRLQIRWAERMDFDGKTAVFLGDVRTRLAADDVACQRMEVELLERIDFASLDNGAEAADSDNRPDVATIYCENRVVVNGGEYQDDQLVSRRHAEFADLRVNQQTGDTHARGPGLVKIWNLGEPEDAENADGSRVKANTTADGPPRQWRYTHVQFDGNSEGNIKHRTTTFHEHVRAIYGPVSDHTQELDPHRIDLAPKGAGWMNCRHLTLTQHRATDSRPAYSEALARGNVRLSGREFQGTADQVTFDESKDQYILKSFGDREAIISMDGRGTQTGQQFKFHPKRKDLTIINAQGGQAVPR